MDSIINLTMDAEPGDVQSVFILVQAVGWYELDRKAAAVAAADEDEDEQSCPTKPWDLVRNGP